MSEIILSEQYKAAVELNQKIMITAQAAQQNLFDMCVMLKQMRDDKLYKELGYQNFEDYCENEVGFSRMQAHKYISIIENIKNVNSSLHFGVTKLALLSTLSEAQQEEIQQTVNIEDTSVRELKEEIARLRQEKSSAEAHLKTAQRQLQSENDDKQAQKKRADGLASDLLDLKSKNRKLSHELEEVREENRQLHQSMTPDQKTADATIRNLDRMLSEADQEHANDLERQRKKYQAEINRLNEQLNNTKTMVETVEVPATRDVFEAYCSVVKNAYEMLMGFVKSIGKSKEYTKAIGEMLDNFDDELCVM